MNILVITGSPKGANSITYQTMLYLKRYFTDHEYRVLHCGQKIRLYEKDFSEPEQDLKWADILVFCYPVYTFLVPAQLQRFIELTKEKGINVSGKYATQISTSKHFYDTTAHEFIRENCEDLGLRYIRGLSADMDDLLKKQGQNQAKAFFHHVLWSVKNGDRKVSVCNNKKDDKRIVVVADCAGDDLYLKAMIDNFTAKTPYRTDVVNLSEFEFAGGCLGCFHCAATGECIYKDGFDTLLRDLIQTADATVYAFSIKDHSMGYKFKLYDDRQFCNGHRTVTMGKPVGYLVNGELSKEHNLQTLIEARSQVGSNYLAGVATNEKDTDRQIDALITDLEYAIRRKYRQPANFYGVGGMKIFRDLIYKMQGLMREDHRFYKKHGFYDFPQKDKGTIVGMYLVGSLMNTGFAKKHSNKFTDGMLMPYKKVIESAGKKHK